MELGHLQRGHRYLVVHAGGEQLGEVRDIRKARGEILVRLAEGGLVTLLPGAILREVMGRRGPWSRRAVLVPPLEVDLATGLSPHEFVALECSERDHAARCDFCGSPEGEMCESVLTEGSMIPRALGDEQAPTLVPLRDAFQGVGTDMVLFYRWAYPAPRDAKSISLEIEDLDAFLRSRGQAGLLPDY